MKQLNPQLDLLDNRDVTTKICLFYPRSTSRKCSFYKRSFSNRIEQKLQWNLAINSAANICERRKYNFLFTMITKLPQTRLDMLIMLTNEWPHSLQIGRQVSYNKTIPYMVDAEQRDLYIDRHISYSKICFYTVSTSSLGTRGNNSTWKQLTWHSRFVMVSYAHTNFLLESRLLQFPRFDCIVINDLDEVQDKYLL